MKWIKIERHVGEEGKEVFDSAMPEDGEEVLISYEDRRGRRWVDLDVFLFDTRGHYFKSYGKIDEGVIAWMPIPEPYQDGEEKRDK